MITLKVKKIPVFHKDKNPYKGRKYDGAFWNVYVLYVTKILKENSDQSRSTLYCEPKTKELYKTIDEIFKNLNSSEEASFYLYNPKYNKNFFLEFNEFHSIKRKK